MTKTTVGDMLEAIGKLPKKAQPKKWNGSPPTKCDICKKPTKDYFADARTKMGPWGILCLQCLKDHGVGIGTGKGQTYRKDENGDFIKIGG